MSNKNIFDNFFNNIPYLILSFVFVTGIASDLKLNDINKKLEAIESNDVKICKTIDFEWIRSDCIGHFNDNLTAEKSADFYLYVSFNLLLTLFFIFFLKGLKKFVSGNLKYLEGRTEGFFDFLNKMSFREKKTPFIKEVKMFLLYSVILFVGTSIIGYFLVMPYLN
jgi:hypothetical protein